jgi:hypothetical protein
MPRDPLAAASPGGGEGRLWWGQCGGGAGAPRSVNLNLEQELPNLMELDLDLDQPRAGAPRFGPQSGRALLTGGVGTTATTQGGAGTTTTTTSYCPLQEQTATA